MKYDIDGLQFRPLKAEEIELRVGAVSEKGATLLLYQDSRCAMNILDETVGRSNWQRDHKEVKGNMYCGIAIWDDDKSQWVWKWDCGIESNTEKEKGESSDAMKRASVNWGIARELYTSPFIFINVPTHKKQGGRGYELDDKYVFSGAYVSSIEYDNKRKIASLEICNSDGDVIFPKSRKKGASHRREAEPRRENVTPYDMITAEDARNLKELIEETNTDTAIFLNYLGKGFNTNIESVDSMTKQQYIKAVSLIEEKKARNNL